MIRLSPKSNIYIMEYPLFSVIIPQKDRSEYLRHTLRTCMMQDYPNFQIIVSDDNSEDNSVEMIRSLMKMDSRIKLFAHERHLGMRDNFEFALAQVTNGYVIALGGDDGLLPDCIWKMYKIIKETKTELLTWPMAKFTYSTSEGSSKNIFTFPRNVKHYTKTIKSKDFFDKITSNYLYQIDECPMFYMKGVASIELINKVKRRTHDNCFYYCPTPDGFSGIVLAGEVSEYIYTNEPLTIGGTTTKSQGQNYRRTDSKSRQEAEQFFNDNIRRTMHASLASQQYSPLEPLMTADYLLTARDLPGWPGVKITEDIDFEKLIRCTFNFMSKANYANEVLVRELEILQEIARQHNLSELFKTLLLTTKRKIIKQDNIYGFALTHSVRFEGSSLGINNIYDASIATPFARNLYKKISLKMLIELFVNTIKILKRSRNYTIEKFPSI